jgi:hypothetical protein
VKLTPVPRHLTPFVAYIRNTGRQPLPEAFFDEDWEPIGPTVRAEMAALGLITYGGPHSGPGPGFDTTPGIYLRPDLTEGETR